MAATSASAVFMSEEVGGAGAAVARRAPMEGAAVARRPPMGAAERGGSDMVRELRRLHAWRATKSNKLKLTHTNINICVACDMRRVKCVHAELT